MSYPDLQHEVAERVEPPGFEEVLARASHARRRRRTTIGAGLAAGVVVAGLAFAVGEPATPEGRSGDPAAPRPSGTWDGTSEVDPALPSEVRELLESEDLHPWASGSGGATAVRWGACDQGVECRFAFVTRSGDEVAARMLSDHASLHPVTGGWLADDGELNRLTPTGDLEPLVDVVGSGPTDVQAGDVAVPTSRGLRLLRGDKLIPVPKPSGRRLHSAHVTASGRLVVTTLSEAGPAVWWTDDGGTWQEAVVAWTSRPAATALLAGHGEGVAVVVLGDESDGSLPVVDVQVSSHAGAPFVRAHGLDLDGSDGVRNASSVSVSSEGTAFVTTESHGLLRVATDGTATTQRRSSHDTSVFTVEDRVCLVAESGRVDHLQCSSDDGLTWTHEPLPGFE